MINRQKRLCLRCKVSFESEGYHNRLCDECRRCREKPDTYATECTIKDLLDEGCGLVFDNFFLGNDIKNIRVRKFYYSKGMGK